MTWTNLRDCLSVRLLRILSACLLLLVSIGQPVHGQAHSEFDRRADSTRVTISMEKPALLDVLKELNRQTGLSIMADGVAKPFTDTMRLDGTLKYVLDKVALTFGYTWRPSSDRTVILRKSFKDPGDFPQTNLPEWQRMAQDINLILQRAYRGNRGTDVFQRADRFYNSLSREQLSTLSSGAYLMGTSLTEEQRTSVWQLCMGARFSRPQEQWKAMDIFLKYLPSGYLQLDSSFGYPIVETRDAHEARKTAGGVLVFVVESSTAHTAPILIWQGEQMDGQSIKSAGKGGRP